MLSEIENLWLAPDTISQHTQRIRDARALTDLVLAGFALALALAAWVITEELEERGKRLTRRPICPTCGRTLESKGLVARSMLTVLGQLAWRRRVWRCPQRCPIGQIAPYDDELELAPYQRTSGELQQIACEFAVFVPFRIAALLVANLVNVTVSSRGIWNWVQRVGSRAALDLQQALEALAKAEAEGGPDALAVTPSEPIRQLPLVMGADGVMVPFRPTPGTPRGKTVWREVKVGILARLGHRFTRTGTAVTILVRRQLVAVLGTLDALQARMWLAAVTSGIHTAPLVVWISDGARGLWRVFAERFQGRAFGVLDFYHAAHHLWLVAKALYDGRTTQAKLWFRLTRHRLRMGQAGTLIQEFVYLARSARLPASVRTTLTQVQTYLATHHQHLDYPLYEALGIPRGSGMVESACKWLIQQRFKGVGMRWSEEGFNHLLHVRLAWVNGSFSQLFRASEISKNSP